VTASYDAAGKQLISAKGFLKLKTGQKVYVHTEQKVDQTRFSKILAAPVQATPQPDLAAAEFNHLKDENAALRSQADKTTAELKKLGDEIAELNKKIADETAARQQAEAARQQAEAELKKLRDAEASKGSSFAVGAWIKAHWRGLTIGAIIGIIIVILLRYGRQGREWTQAVWRQYAPGLRARSERQRDRASDWYGSSRTWLTNRYNDFQRPRGIAPRLQAWLERQRIRLKNLRIRQPRTRHTDTGPGRMTVSTVTVIDPEESPKSIIERILSSPIFQRLDQAARKRAQKD
jgi:ElaB/YqjD/DUF883 family membrane-anchored ribosome-binding protein